MHLHIGYHIFPFFLTRYNCMKLLSFYLLNICVEICYNVYMNWISVAGKLVLGGIVLHAVHKHVKQKLENDYFTPETVLPQLEYEHIQNIMKYA